MGIQEAIRTLEDYYNFRMGNNSIVIDNFVVSQAISICLAELKIKAVRFEYDLNKIILASCEIYGYTVEQFKSKNRTVDIISARRMVYAYLKERDGDDMNNSAAGYLVAEQDHATVLHAIKKHNDLMFSCKNYRYKYEEFKRKLNTVC